MATEKWIAGSGQGLTWGSAIASSLLASLSSIQAIASDVVVTNGTALDIFADVSITLASAAFAAPNFIGVYLYPLNSDGTSYGDGRFGTAGTGPPPSNYAVGSIGLVAATQAQTGSLVRVVLPPGSFKFVFYNQGGVALSTTSSANSASYRTYNRSIA